MTKRELLIKLTANLKTYIKSLGHIESGELLKTAKVVSSGEFNLAVEGPDYMIYLDDGEFINNYFSLPSTVVILEEYLLTYITSQLTIK